MLSLTDARTDDQPSSLRDFVGLHVHLIGIGGAGLGGAAALLLTLGARVSGSDEKPFEGLGELVEAGARVSVGHNAAQLGPDVELVVISAAIPKSNPELAAARARGIRVIKYARMLAWLMRCSKRGVAVAGTHGKSTTTALCVHLFRRAGLDPSFLVGAQCKQLGGGSGVGAGPHFIVESCEYDRSFLQLVPDSAAILNIESDHLDYYGGLDAILDAFRDFARNIPTDGLLVCNGDDPRAVEVAGASSCVVQTFGFAEGVDWRAVDLQGDRGCYSFGVEFRGEPLFSTRLSIPGRHNVANALTAIALAHHAGAGADRLADGVSTFNGVDRRLSWCGEGRGVTVVDDYAHHPTEIRVSIEAARFRYRPKRTWVVFQPHQHSRTRLMMDDLALSFEAADEIIVPDIFDARDSVAEDDPNGSAELVSRIRKSGGRVRYMPDLKDVAEHLVENVEDGDLVLTMGAGDIWKVADELVARIC